MPLPRISAMLRLALPHCRDPPLQSGRRWRLLPAVSGRRLGWPRRRASTQEFQWTRGPEIERRLQEIRVPAVAFPRGERVLERTPWGMRRLVGAAVKTGEEVEVLEVPWDVPLGHAHLAEEVSNHVEALKQLALSPYFLDYLGCDFSSHSGVGLHFVPFKRGVCLRRLVRDVGPMHEINPLFQYWAREILLGLRDYLYQCCQELTSDLSLEHVFAHQEGLQVLLQGLPFGGRRGALMEEFPDCGPECRWRNDFVPMESRLIAMYGAMLLELLYGEQDLDDPVPPLHSLSAGLRAIVSQALNTRETLDHLSVAVPETRKRPEELPPDGCEAELVGTGGFNGEVCELPWVRRRPDARPLLPNPERSLDAVGRPGPSSAQPSAAGEASREEAKEKAVPQLRWEPNPDMLTIQGLLNNPTLYPQRSESFPALMDAWESYCGGQR
uniref:Uncharacterized protein n=1 Tax=Alexandrium monilatum TaxID=311494 RepID=A0A7S4PW88_9DINO